jgi:IS5 family transposase
VAVDETHTLIRAVTLTAANVHDSQEFENVVKGDEEMVMADKAYWSRERSEWCGRKGVANGILRKASRGEKLRASAVRANRLFSSIRCKIEKVFGWWKRSAGYSCQLGKLKEAMLWLEKTIDVAGKKDIRLMALDDEDLQPLLEI